MSRSVKLPQWGMSMSEGTVTEWLVAEGDTVQADQVLVEIEAAKLTSTIAAPVAGTVGPLLTAEGETIPINTVLCEIFEPGEQPTGSDAGPQLPLGEVAEIRPTVLAPDTPAPDVPAPDTDAAAAAAGQTAGVATGRVTNVVPLARKVAREMGIDLRTVTGTGTNGRIVVRDVEQAMMQTAPPEEPAAPPAEAPAAGGTSARAQRLSPMRRIIGDRMTASLHEAAQLTLVSTADVTDFAQLRDSVGAGARKPGYVDAVIRACALALRDHPGINARLDGESIVPADAVNIGLAVALDDGLVVPVIRDADRLGLAEIGEQVSLLAEAARSGRLAPDDVAGGSFSVTSLGGQGIDAFTPILNPPESAILGVGRSREVPTRFGDGLVWRQELTLSLTIDHRIVDGYPGALFLQDVVRWLEHPKELI